MSQRSFYYTWNRQPAEDVFQVERAECDEFILKDGRRVYDFVSTSFQTHFGHNNSIIRDSIAAQLSHMSIASPKSTFALKEEVSDQLIQLFDLGEGRIFYTVSGSESVENALKMARQITDRTKVLARQKSYHGASLGALSVTGDWRNEPHFTVDEQTIRIPEPTDDPSFVEARNLVEANNPQTFAAIILETISGTNGVAIPSQQWFDGVQQLCHEHGIMLIIDEVLVGFGRTGPNFAYQAYNLRPDFVCTSKGISGGYIPFGAVWTGPRITEYYDHETLTCGLTNYAHPLGLAAARGVLAQLNCDSFQQRKQELERHFAQQIQLLATEFDAELRQQGLLAAIEFPDDHALPSWHIFFDHGLYLYSKANMIVLAPPFVSSHDRLDQAFASLRAILSSSN